MWTAPGQLENDRVGHLSMVWETAEPSLAAHDGQHGERECWRQHREIVNDGTAPVVDPIIALTASGGTLVNPTMIISAIGVSLKFQGRIANTKALVIDCGAMTIRNRSTGSAYSGFSLESGRTTGGCR